MASVFKPTYVKTDPKTGKKVKKKLKKWYVKYRDVQGIERRVPGFSDKSATQQLASKLERDAELGRMGIIDPFEKQRKRPLSDHLDEFETHLRDKANCKEHIYQTASRSRRVVAWCGFQFLSDISASAVQRYLADLRERGRSIQTSNHYLAAIKEFCRWLVLDRRTGDSPIAHLKKQNVATDRRHDRRPLQADEFSGLLDAALAGPVVEGLTGADRVMLYIMAAWTGFRRGELASLSLKSLNLNGDSPTVRVEASHSKRRRADEIPLHPVVVERLREWLATKALDDAEPLFPLMTPKGHFRKTAKMMRLDLERARKAWIKKGDTAEEKVRREQSQYLQYHDEDGLFADFHSNRHMFISNLGRAGVSPKVAQTLARHSDINLTMNIYSHVGLNDQASAVRELPAPPMPTSTPASTPASTKEVAAKKQALRSTGTDGRHIPQHVRTPVSKGDRLASDGRKPEFGGRQPRAKKNDVNGRFDADWQASAGDDAVAVNRMRDSGSESTEPKVTGSNPVGCIFQKSCRTLNLAYLPASGSAAPRLRIPPYFTEE